MRCDVCDHVVLDDMTSAFHHTYSVSQPLQTQQLGCPTSLSSAPSVRHTSAMTQTCEGSARSPSKVKAERHRVKPAAALIWSPARDIENEKHKNRSRSEDETIQHSNTSSSSSKR